MLIGAILLRHLIVLNRPAAPPTLWSVERLGPKL